MKDMLYKIFGYFGIFLIGVLLVPTSAFLLMIKLIWHCMDILLEKTGKPPQLNNFTEPNK